MLSLLAYRVGRPDLAPPVLRGPYLLQYTVKRIYGNVHLVVRMTGDVEEAGESHILSE